MRRLYQSKLLFTGIVSILFFSCKVSEISTTQIEQLPGSYGEVTEGNLTEIPSAALISWENYFEDPHIKSLIQVALNNNQDNLKTLEKIKIARANLGIARGGLLPEINGIAGVMRRRFGEYTMDGVGNTDSNLSPTVPEDKQIPDPYRDFVLGAQFSWEIDVWGKLKSRKRAAFERYLASEEMANYIKTWLIGEVVTHYYQLIALDEELRILDSNIELQERAVNLSKDLKDSGKENQLAVDQFEALMLNSKALLIERQRQLRTTELNLSRLLGMYVLEHDRTTLDETFDGSELIEVGMPSELLRLRPDIRIAERELIASKADVNAARAAFFPSLNLTGMAGYNAFDFGKLFFSPASMVYQLGAGLTAPVFNRNRIRMEMETAKASQKIAYLDYEQTVFKSYLEILNLINEFETYDEQLQLKSYEVEVQKRSVENSNIMFRVGYADYLEVLNAQSRALQSEIELIGIKKEQLQTNVRLYVALGGGWM